MTAGAPTAVVTEQCRGKSASVKKDQYLIVGGKFAADGFEEWLRESIDYRTLLEIEQMNWGWFGTTCTFGELQVGVVTLWA